MKKDLLFKKENNLFQSLNWLAFQENYGREVVHFSNCSGISFDLPLGRKGIWIQKGPDKITKALLSEFRKASADFVRIEPKEICQSDIKDYKLRYVSEKSLLCGQKSPKATQIIDITGEEDEIQGAMKSKTRYNIRLAGKKGVTVQVTDDEDILCNLLSETAKRQKGYSPHPKEYYTKLVKDLARNDVAHIFVAYNKDLNPIAAILVSFFGEVATYLHGGFSDKDRNLMAPFLCQMEAIRYAKKKGCRYYDMWGVAETDNPSDPWAGITRFKEGFGGEKIVFPGAYDYVLNNFWYNTLTLLSKIKKVIR
ncbi:MAG: peptidoglycan bridge formation glycyltransferase FemA/FemB family protein [Patescibacteria group bacterium]|nr:peptidoglycan bridge formation glycyltransferase FemA/FemB family protein [Patescibacteria group bacterium]